MREVRRLLKTQYSSKFMCSFVFRSTSYCEVKQGLLYRIETLCQYSQSPLDIVKPFVSAVATTINQEQYSSSYILISSDANPILKHVR